MFFIVLQNKLQQNILQHFMCIQFEWNLENAIYPYILFQKQFNTICTDSTHRMYTHLKLYENGSSEM